MGTIDFYFPLRVSDLCILSQNPLFALPLIKLGSGLQERVLVALASVSLNKNSPNAVQYQDGKRERKQC